MGAQIHRFRDRVAIYVGSGETVYLSPKEAKQIARALNAAAREIQSGVPFSASVVGTLSLKLEERSK